MEILGLNQDDIGTRDAGCTVGTEHLVEPKVVKGTSPDGSRPAAPATALSKTKQDSGLWYPSLLCRWGVREGVVIIIF